MSKLPNSKLANIYGPRAATYSETWHALHAKDYINHAALERGQRVLDLACGTGLFAIPAAKVVGKDGLVVGIDITPEMLEVATERAAKEAAPPNLYFVPGDMSKLEDVRLPNGTALQEDAYDLIISASAVPLLRKPSETLKTWVKYLKPNAGRVLFDVPTEKHWLGGLIFETAAKDMGLPLANVSGRAEVTGPDYLETILKNAGFVVEKVFVASGYGSGAKRYEAGDWEEEFDKWMKTGFIQGLDAQSEERLRKDIQRKFSDYGGEKKWFEDEEGFYIAVGQRL